MKLFVGTLVLFIIPLSLFQAEGHLQPPWHICMEKFVNDETPDPCLEPNCNALCHTLHHGKGVGLCTGTTCWCKYPCVKDDPPPPRDIKLTDDEGIKPEMAWSSNKDLKPDQISKMEWSSSKHQKSDQNSRIVPTVSSKSIKP